MSRLLTTDADGRIVAEVRSTASVPAPARVVAKVIVMQRGVDYDRATEERRYAAWLAAFETGS